VNVYNYISHRLSTNCNSNTNNCEIKKFSNWYYSEIINLNITNIKIIDSAIKIFTLISTAPFAFGVGIVIGTYDASFKSTTYLKNFFYKKSKTNTPFTFKNYKFLKPVILTALVAATVISLYSARNFFIKPVNQIANTTSPNIIEGSQNQSKNNNIFLSSIKKMGHFFSLKIKEGYDADYDLYYGSDSYIVAKYKEIKSTITRYIVMPSMASRAVQRLFLAYVLGFYISKGIYSKLGSDRLKDVHPHIFRCSDEKILQSILPRPLYKFLGLNEMFIVYRDRIAEDNKIKKAIKSRSESNKKIEDLKKQKEILESLETDSAPPDQSVVTSQ